MPCGWGVKTGMVRVWVAGKTVWSPCYMLAISERFRDKELIYKALYKFAFFTFFLLYFTVSSLVVKYWLWNVCKDGMIVLLSSPVWRSSWAPDNVQHSQPSPDHQRAHSTRLWVRWDTRCHRGQTFQRVPAAYWKGRRSTAFSHLMFAIAHSCWFRQCTKCIIIVINIFKVAWIMKLLLGPHRYRRRIHSL